MNNKINDNTYRNISEILSFESTPLELNIRNNTDLLYFYEFINDLKYINISNIKYFESRIVSQTVPEYKTILDFFDIIGGIY